MSVLSNRRGALRVLLATAFAAVTAPVVAAAASRTGPAPAPAKGGPPADRPLHAVPGGQAPGEQVPGGQAPGWQEVDGHGAAGAPGAAVEVVFEEVHRGRRIRGVRGHSRVAAAHPGGEWRVTVDDQPLQLMRRADGSYLSMIDHYGSYPTPREAVRAAVDQLLPGERLSGLSHGSASGGVAGVGRGHGVHA
jgi:hypothetical protein